MQMNVVDSPRRSCQADNDIQAFIPKEQVKALVQTRRVQLQFQTFPLVLKQQGIIIEQ